jgi:menaquinone-dependent protoporphyrinogen oxidase
MATRLLIAYAIRFGSTEEVATAMALTFADHGFTPDPQPVGHVTSVTDYDAVVLGSAVNYGTWLRAALDFASTHSEELNARPLALFSVHVQNLNDDAESNARREAYLDNVQLSLDPVAVAFFAGRTNRDTLEALMPTWLARIVPKVDFRDWGQIRAWAEDVAPLLHGK